ncbi:MAG TPA: hypothetical protein DCZ72_04455, partial [Armatimonadetes bacterium]|nr:hypothetical protein [Armatimonadota bacterium]
MKCAGCVAAINDALRTAPGVAQVAVSLGNNSADVTFDPQTIDLAGLVAAVQGAGFQAAVAGDQADAAADATHHAELRALLGRLVVIWPIAILLMAAMVGDWLSPVWQAVLAAPVWLWGGWPYHHGAWIATRHGRADMNTLISLGTSVAYVASLAWLLAGQQRHHWYFETTAMILAFALLGRYLEAHARNRTGGELRALLALRPRTARVRRGEIWTEVAAELLAVGDVYEVRAGEAAPADGVILEGRAEVDESPISGESKPVAKGPGDRLIGATLNLNGRLVVQAEAVGADALLGRIIALVREAQGSQAPIQSLADRVAAVFVPVVVAIAALAAVVWWAADSLPQAIERAVAVLVVACPCAVGLATPTAIMVGTGRGARLGLLVKGGAVLEAAAGVHRVVFDKTGTLTAGQP